MPYALITIGIGLFVSALNGTLKALGSQLYQDLFVSNNTGSSYNVSTGAISGYQPSFIVWILALLIVGLIGYIPEFKKTADAFMALIVIVMVVGQKGFGTVIVQDIENALAKGPQPQASATPLAAVPVQVGGTSAPSSNVLVPAVTSIIGAH